MSRLGKKPIAIPKGVEATFAEGVLTVKGPKGTLVRPVREEEMQVVIADGFITFTPKNETKLAFALWGTYAALFRNMVKGVTEGFERKLEIEGVGYRAELVGADLKLLMGYSHPVMLKTPEGIKVEVVKSLITLSGIDKEALGQHAANIRAVRKPEPYKGKGIRYQGEFIIRKQGKKSV
ncbi:50S ribosomal protein L6 [Candidatus Kaiserbacteria bacterium RIFCSPHIGHO2_02_FULL_50_50]|uniref:Large ribosomal subunit protein uL6 n=1 Tax=Candidatus Kaiserbacteria bacterium RIFCSPHIGHO2_02_FULL_50_50 TaxID=1798492 RepID=A0A1F6DEW4_9BACT|nr:MAG: 50S ribosomal protein L6 [Candidatus Kaiserbacteria bacterium RIFCSPHIGHO2_02_FULL_50_50]OGG88742.1 MAG: 50S ribosomal protein L6 [Candidatus Kaiserbacteria bacterium RIFCSPLOWO2_12_FULL_50_10]